ncbi:PREDICTED: ALBINO3-like protein 2, chloroplastic [Tarenaya hassleriana]|uniref:ALBINO3-like protein 2, chloroplastic n=1 Tax=Tarenaya hassleriana TaxID=28532 RepID=UPI00053C446F|nr:PREDICTED: ALBINO3-like protein 2, chloroplastic [Tarenaya hassleriana]
MATWRCLRASSLYLTRRRISALSVVLSSCHCDHTFLPHKSLPPLPGFSSPRRLFSSVSERDFPNPDLGFREISGGISDESSLPVLTVIHFLDGFHQFTGLPWWMVIASSTVAVRLALFPLLVLQLRKLKRISELLPQLPTQGSEPLSAGRLVDQFSSFLKESRANRCPSLLWFFPYLSVQFPCFFLLMTSIRKMSLDGHPGFDSGGALWFQNLSAFSEGLFGPVFPVLIAGLHYINIKVSFDSSTVRQTSGLTGFFIKYYKLYLEILSVPLVFVGYIVPQGSLVYWVTNSSISLFQHLSLKHPAVAAKLGLLGRSTSLRAEDTIEINGAAINLVDSDSKGQTISLQNLTPEELLALSVQLLSKGDRETSIHLLRLALDKDPEYVRGLVLMGQALLQRMELSEATEYLELAISKLLDGHASKVEEDAELLMLASQWAGAAYVQQGNMKRGIIHLERVAKLKEPCEHRSKEHYFESLLILSSALYREGQKEEAAKILRLVVDYKPEYEYLLDQCEDENDLVGDLVSSRRER